MNVIDDNRAALPAKPTSIPAAAPTTKKAKALSRPSPEEVRRQQERRQNLDQLEKMAKEPRDYQNYDAAFAVFTQKELDFQQEEAFAAEEKAEAAAAAAGVATNPFSFVNADRRARARRAAKERMLQLIVRYTAPPPVKTPSPPTRRRRRSPPVQQPEEPLAAAAPVEETVAPAAEVVYYSDDDNQLIPLWATKRFKAQRAALREKRA